jgi:hypothetical protein
LMEFTCGRHCEHLWRDKMRRKKFLDSFFIIGIFVY